jgi:hypothetical protein
MMPPPAGPRKVDAYAIPLTVLSNPFTGHGKLVRPLP